MREQGRMVILQYFVGYKPAAVNAFDIGYCEKVKGELGVYNLGILQRFGKGH